MPQGNATTNKNAIINKFTGPSNETAQGLLESGNILNLYNRPVTQSPAGPKGIEPGNWSTTYSKSFNLNGKETLIPTVVNGKFLTDQEAIDRYKDTGQHLGKFDTPKNADKYSIALHNSQEAYGKFFGRTSNLMPQNNQEPQISPRSGILSKAQDYIYGSEAGRRLMDATDTINKFTGGYEGTLGNVGNVAPGASMAITPFLEDMAKSGIIKKAANLFGEDRGLFMDKMGDVYDLGHMYEPGSMVHEQAFSEANKMPIAYSGGKPIAYDLPQALQNENLMRLRRAGRTTNIEMTQAPSNAQLEQLMALSEKSPKMQWGADLHNLNIPRDYENPTFMENPKAYQGTYGNFDQTLDAIYKFFGK